MSVVKVADDQDGFMSKILKLAQLVEHHQVAKGEVRTCRVDAEFDAQRAVAVETVLQFGFTDDRIGVGANGFDQAHVSEVSDWQTSRKLLGWQSM